jgi:SprT protein
VGLQTEQIINLLGTVDSRKVAEIESKAELVYSALEVSLGVKLERAKIVYDLKGATAGYAYGTRLIRLNSTMLNDPRYYDDMVNQVLPHEIAHCVVHDLYPKAKSHGWEWANIMHRLNLPADRCHQYDVVPAKKTKKFRYTCSCGTKHEMGSTRHRRAQSGISYRCAKCRGRVTWTGESS